MNERELIAACRKGESSAFRRLAETFYDRIYRVARTLESDSSEAEDLTQDAFTAALRAVRTFRGDSGVFTWLVSILRNTWMNRRRKQKRVRYKADIDPGIAVDEGPGRSDAAADLKTVFQELEAEDRLVLELYHYEEMKYQEIGEALDIPVGTVKSRLFHARQKLRTLLEGSHAV